MEAIVISQPAEQLHGLLDELTQLCNHVLQRGNARLLQQSRFINETTLNKSCVNLAQYLALRELDLRPLQEQLAEAGLSSLGRAEPHVYANLSNTVNLLGMALDVDMHLHCEQPYPGFREGYELLIRNTARILGPSCNQHETRIMVTLPSEAAENKELIDNLVREGMDCARINCAHDTPAVWLRMIQHIRQAAISHKRECRVLMDLAGHKVRTGPVALETSTIHIKVRKDIYGLPVQPAHILLIPDTTPAEDQPEETENTTVIPLPEHIWHRLLPGDRLAFTDTRGKKRYLHIYATGSAGEIDASCKKNTYLKSGSRMHLLRKHSTRYKIIESFDFIFTRQRPVKILLATGDTLLLHKTPAPGEPARYNERGQLIAPAHISCTKPEVIDALAVGNPVWIDDGKISCSVTQQTTEAATLRVLRTAPKGAKLHPDKGLNFPETDLHLPALSEKDKQDLDFVCQHADMVGFSFVETGDDMRQLMQELALRKRADLPIVAKIETPRAVRNLPEILFSTMSCHPLAIMIARGDLAVELGSERMVEIQEEILWLCEAAHVPVIWATQVLESIAKHGVRSRPEFTDAAMGIRAECVMLNKGPFILDAVRSLDGVLKRMHAHQRKKISRLRALHW